MFLSKILVDGIWMGCFQVQGLSARLCHLHVCVAQLISRAGGCLRKGLPGFGLDCVLLDAPMQNASTSYLRSTNHLHIVGVQGLATRRLIDTASSVRLGYP